jgi:hypothetical protein
MRGERRAVLIVDVFTACDRDRSPRRFTGRRAADRVRGFAWQ